MQKQQPCPKCNNSQRDNDFNKPCNLCGAKEYYLIGYRYPKEAKEIFTMIGIVSGLILLALIAGVTFLVVTQIQLIP